MRRSLNEKRAALVALMLEIKQLDRGEYDRLLVEMRAAARRSRRHVEPEGN
jgi:hypothetical protein